MSAYTPTEEVLRDQTLREQRDFREHLLWRAKLLREAADDVDMQDAIREACKRDPIYFFNAFLWTHDPREDEAPVVPFLTYPFQDRTIRKIAWCMDHKRDMVAPKSRTMGVSWMVLGEMFRRWLFFDDLTFLLLSRKEEEVDLGAGKNNRKTLFGKLDMMLSMLPSWMKPSFDRMTRLLVNYDTGSIINGESTNADAGRSARATAIMLDEVAVMDNDYDILAATGQTTRCRIFVSTFKGTGNAFYELATHPAYTSVERVPLHWSIHPLYNRGIYRGTPGNLEVFDPEGAPDGYNFILDGKVRSPWYDFEEGRAGNDSARFAQEIDMDPAAAGSLFFPRSLITVCQANCRLPVVRGNFAYDPSSLDHRGFSHDATGKLKLWLPLDARGLPPEDSYVLAADISQGTGASNSVISIGSTRLGEKVGSWVCPKTPPHEMAKVFVALARIFKDNKGNTAFGIWEANGPGRVFGNAVMELGHRNVYYRNAREGALSSKPTDFPGFQTTQDSKEDLLKNYYAALSDVTFVNRDEESIRELEDYQYDARGKVECVKARTTTDNSGARDSHGDRVIADALLSMIVSPAIKDALKTKKDEARKIPPSCPAMRFKAHANRFSRTF